MPLTRGRRAFLAGTFMIFTAAKVHAAGSDHVVRTDAVARAKAEVAAIERRNGGRLGVAVLDTGSGLSITYRPTERFPMCSTFKLLAAAAVLKRVDEGTEHLDRRVPFGAVDLCSYAPVTKAHVAESAMSLGDLCAAAIQWSDNTAANLMLRAIDGPAGFTRYARSLGDPVTRLDRTEPTLNTAIPGDERDTTAPASMLRDMRSVLLKEALSPNSRQQLLTWLIGDQVGGARLRAGLPPTWRIGDKTGTGDNGTANTLAIMWPPDRPPILAAVYFTGCTASADVLNSTHAAVARVIASTF
jgi:beta-lactamase class A